MSLWKSLTLVCALASLSLTAGASAAPLPKCWQAASRTIALTQPNAKDVLEIQASGPSCIDAVATISIRLQTGEVISAFAIPVRNLFEGNLDNAAKPKSLIALLRSYVQDAELDIGARQLPDWTTEDPTPGFSDGHELTSPLSREHYAQLRATKSNMLCMRHAFETFACFVWDKDTKRAEEILRH